MIDNMATERVELETGSQNTCSTLHQNPESILQLRWRPFRKHTTRNFAHLYSLKDAF